MKTRTLGKSGLRASEVGLGCWQLGGDFGPLGEERARQILAAADASGINFWDTADVYGAGQSESRIADFRRAHDPDVIVATKVGRDAMLYPDGYTKEKVRANIEASRQRLGVEVIDLVQLHCVPRAVLAAGELLEWMAEFQKDGLIRAFGASVETIDEALLAARHPQLASLQIIFNLFRQNAINDLFPAAKKNNIGIIVRLPLASGVLAGKMSKQQQFADSDHRNYNRDGKVFSQGETFSGVPFDQAVDLVEAIRPWLPEGMSMAQMAVRWILDQPEVTTVIAGASRPQQVRENAAVSDLPPLPAPLHDKLAELYSTRVEPKIVVPV